MSTKLQNRRGRKAVSRLLHVVLLALRVLAVVVSVQVSGAGILVAELACVDDAGDGCCTDCPLEKDGKECPPGCPNCHCSHGGIALAPAFESVTTQVVEIDERVLQRPYEAGVPHAPKLPSVYRPPRFGPVFQWAGQRSA